MNNRNHPITAADARVTSSFVNSVEYQDPTEAAKLGWNPASLFEEDPEGDYDEGGAFGDCLSPDRVAARRTAADSCGATSRNDSFITLDIEGEHLYQDAAGTWRSYRTGKPYKPWKKSRKQPQRGVQS